VVLSGDSLTVAAGGSGLVDVLANDVAGTGVMQAATLAVTTAPTKGVAVVEAGQIRYTANAGTSDTDSFGYTACDDADACGTATVTITITVNQAPTATGDSYSVDAGATLNVAAPGVLGNDSDPDTGDTLQARLGTGVSAGNLLLFANGAFNYTPAPTFAGTDSFTYFVVDGGGLTSAPVTVTIDVVPEGPLAVDDAYQTTTDNPLTVPAPGVLANDRDVHTTEPLTAKLDRAPFRGILELNPDGSFVYTPDPGVTGTDTFRYVAVNIDGVPSAFAVVTIDITAPSGPVPTLTCTAPVDGSAVTAPTPVTAAVTAPAGETIAQWSVSARNTDGGVPVVLASGAGEPPATLATFDPTVLVNGNYEILTTAESSGGGKSTCAIDVFVTGEMKLGDYRTTYLDMETSIAGFPVQVLRTYDTTDTRVGDFGVGWRLELSGPRATPNGRLGQGGWFTEEFGFPFTQHRFRTTKPHFVTVTSPGGRVEVFDLTPPPHGPFLPLTTPTYTARPGTGTTSTLEDANFPTLAFSAADSTLVEFIGGFGGPLYDPRLFRLTTKEGVVMIIDRFDGLQSMTDRNGNEIVFTPEGVTSPSTTRSLAFTRDGAGRITQIDGPSGKHTEYEYSLTGDLSRFVDAGGAPNTFAYDGGHRLLSVDGPGGVRLRTLSYGPDGRLASITDGTGRTTTLSSDVNARSTILTSPSGRLTTLTTYGADGYPASVEEAFDGHSRVTSYEYDAEARVTRTTKPLGRVETLTYDAAGNITSRTTPKNETWSFAYDAFSQPTTTTAPDGAIIESFTYDALGNLTAATERDGTVVSYVNDARGLPIAASNSFGTTSAAYDANHQLTSVTNPAGGVTQMTYDDSGRIDSIQNAAGEITQLERNALDQLVKVTAANGSSYELAYDALGRMASVTDTGGRTTAYEYDAAGRPVKYVDRGARSATYTYDEDGNVATISYTDGEVQAGTWDPVGRLVSLADADTIVEYRYSDADDLISERTRGNNGVALPDVTLTYTTDSNGQRITRSGPGGVIGYGYDTRGRLSSLEDDVGNVFMFAYDGTNRLTGLLRPNGVNDTLAYREKYVISRNASIGGSVRGRAEYSLDALARHTALTDLDGSHSFVYNLADRLVAASHPAGSGLPAESFSYDAVGNRTSWSGSPLGSVTHNAAMELTSDGTYDYTYDAEGRLTQRRNRATGDVTRYAWSDTGVLNSISAPNGATSAYRYDVLGRRLEANEDGTIRRFAYSGWNLAHEFDGTNSLQATYVAGLFPDGVYEIVRDGNRYFPLFDGVGSVTTLTDVTGAAVGRVRYSAFGIPEASGIAEDGVSFTGHQFDAATGLIYARARYYDPALGRFLSQDPEPAINPYEYAFNAPLEFTDPTGRNNERAEIEAIMARDKVSFGRAQEILRRERALASLKKAGPEKAADHVRDAWNQFPKSFGGGR
jgi:RHS repeat-associated protein